MRNAEVLSVLYGQMLQNGDFTMDGAQAVFAHLESSAIGALSIIREGLLGPDRQRKNGCPSADRTVGSSQHG